MSYENLFMFTSLNTTIPVLSILNNYTTSRKDKNKHLRKQSFKPVASL